MLGISLGYWILMGAISLIGQLVQSNLKRKFKKYTQIPLKSGLSGQEVAQKMLRESGVLDVEILSVRGQLTDHYNPLDKTVNLSPEIYSGRSVMAAAVAAHECGHALQHAKAYPFLSMRSSLVPVLSISSKYMHLVLMAGMFLIAVTPVLFWIGILMFGLTTLFSFITLPVEFDATNRAKIWLNDSNLTSSAEQEGVRDALSAAAMTYVTAALSSLAILLYYISMALGRRNR